MEDFYQVISIETPSEKEFSVKIALNPSHAVFSGHFPDNPIVPGVCMMQISKDLLEQITKKKVMLTSGNNIKFMALINPFLHPELLISLTILPEETQIKVKNTTCFLDKTVALKMNLTYTTDL